MRAVNHVEFFDLISTTHGNEASLKARYNLDKPLRWQYRISPARRDPN